MKNSNSRTKRINFLIKIVIALNFITPAVLAQDEAKMNLVLREAKEYENVIVAIQAYLIDNILEVKVTAKIYAAKPKIDNVILVGPKLGRLAPKAKSSIFATEEEEEPYLTTQSRGLLGLGDRDKEVKKAKGTTVKELYKFIIPREKILPNKRYELRVKIESDKIEGQFARFNFNLKDLPKLIHDKP